MHEKTHADIKKRSIRSTQRGMSLFISIRVGSMPIPRARNDLLQVRMRGLPTKVAHDLLRRSHQPRGITGSARGFDCQDLVPGYSTRRLDHLAHGEAVPASDIVDHFVA